MLSRPTSPPLTLIERIFLRVWCYPPPDAPFEPRDAYDPQNPIPLEVDPLGRTRRVYGETFERSLQGRVLLDIGCGKGDQVIAAALAGATLAVGVDSVDVNVKMGTANAAKAGVAERVRLTSEPMSALGTEWADVALSQNSFEHFTNPAEILTQVYAALKPGGEFFVTFGPSWWHPFGVHHMFMIRLPWAHVIFSEKTILRVRQLYRPNKPTCWKDVWLNQMTIKKLLSLVATSGFELSHFAVTPIRPLPRWLVKTMPFREWTTSDVSVILTKPRP